MAGLPKGYAGCDPARLPCQPRTQLVSAWPGPQSTARTAVDRQDLEAGFRQVLNPKAVDLAHAGCSPGAGRGRPRTAQAAAMRGFGDS